MLGLEEKAQESGLWVGGGGHKRGFRTRGVRKAGGDGGKPLEALFCLPAVKT